MKKAARLIAVLFAMVGVCLVVRWNCAYTPPIAGPQAIASLEQVTLGGDSQWILIRGRDRHKPILLFLHGGPGMPAMYLAHAFQRPLEEDFVVVQWDRRGAGKSFRPDLDPSKISTAQEVADTAELIEYLCGRFDQPKVFLVGHSYGTLLGALVAQRLPDRLYAYVGIGQLAGTADERRAAQDAWLKECAVRTHDGTLTTALTAGAQFDREGALFACGGELRSATSFWALVRIGLLAPEYSLRDVKNVRDGVAFTHRNMRYNLVSEPLERALPEFRVPVYFFTGRNDYTDPFVLTERYFDLVRAPRKQMVWFEQSAHFPFLEEPERFATEMRYVRGQALPAGVEGAHPTSEYARPAHPLDGRRRTCPLPRNI